MFRLLLLAGLAFLGWAHPSAAAPLKIACIGDSIAEGSGLSSPTTESYPAKLGRLLGPAYQVQNFGVSGRTLLKKGDFPYWRESAFTNSQKANPDIVIIKLGTNDSKPQNWRYSTNFVADMEELIASYTNLTSHPRILLCTPCPVYASGAFDIKPGIVRTNIAPAIRDLAARLGHAVLDFQVLLTGHAEWFPDTVHPNSRGTTVMAAMARTAVVGENPESRPPALKVVRGTGSRAVLEWPANWAGWVLQSATALAPTGSTWTVVETVAVNDGGAVRVTNTLSGLLRFYRLWWP